MESVSTGEWVEWLAPLATWANACTLFGLALNIGALIVLMRDIGRVHADVTTQKTKGEESAELELGKLIDRKYKSMAAAQDAERGARQGLLSREEFDAEMKQILYWHQRQMILVDQVRSWNIIGSKVSTGKSKRAARWATAMAVVGSLLQVAPALVAK